MKSNSHGSLDLDLLSNFIHQVVNPLNGVMGTLDNIIDGTVPPEKRTQRLRAVRAQLEWSVMLIRNLAYFTKVSLVSGAPTDMDSSKTCVIPQIIIEASLFFQEPGLSRGIRIHLEDRETQYAVSGSPDLLRQVFMNLFDNAVKYSDVDSDVRIESRPQKKTGHLVVEVINTGIGFLYSERERLFDVGWRGREAEDRIKSGTGLGLFICRQILKDVFNSSIEAEHSEKTRTTVFRLRFPQWRIT